MLDLQLSNSIQSTADAGLLMQKVSIVVPSQCRVSGEKVRELLLSKWMLAANSVLKPVPQVRVNNFIRERHPFCLEWTARFEPSHGATPSSSHWPLCSNDIRLFPACTQVDSRDGTSPVERQIYRNVRKDPTKCLDSISANRVAQGCLLVECPSQLQRRVAHWVRFPPSGKVVDALLVRPTFRACLLSWDVDFLAWFLSHWLGNQPCFAMPLTRMN